MSTKPKTTIVPFVRNDNFTEREKRTCYLVHGFWSGDYVRFSCFRNLITKEWHEHTVGWSCGERYPKEEPDNTVAAECFALALLDAVQVARQWVEDDSKAKNEGRSER